MDFIVLAGGSPEEPLAQSQKVAAKSQVILDGRPMVDYVIAAIRESGVAGRVVCIGPQLELAHPPDIWLPDLGSSLSNLKQSLAHVQGEQVAVATADDPFLSPAAIAWVVNNASPQAKFVYPVVNQLEVEKRWPGMKRTYARLVEGKFTGGNLMIIAPASFENISQIAERIVKNRKNVFALARIIGVGVLFKFLIRRLKITDIEARAEQILGQPLQALITPFPEIGVDIDDQEDLAWWGKDASDR